MSGNSSSDTSSTISSCSVKRSRSKKSRQELNVVEKHRLSRIADQIQDLYGMLKDAGVTCKKSKQAILGNTQMYIQKLQAELYSVKQENKALVEQQTELLFLNQNTTVAPLTKALSDVDYSLLFNEAALPMAVSGLDGNFIHCNKAFCDLSGFETQELKTISFFNLTAPEEMHNMYEIINKTFNDPMGKPQHFWKQCNMKNKTVSVYVTMSLIRNQANEPKYFHCVVIPMPDLPASFCPNDTSEPKCEVYYEGKIHSTSTGVESSQMPCFFPNNSLDTVRCDSSDPNTFQNSCLEPYQHSPEPQFISPSFDQLEQILGGL